MHILMGIRVLVVLFYSFRHIVIERLNKQRNLIRKLILKYAVAVVYQSTFRCCAAAAHTQPERERPTNKANVQI